MSSNFKKNLKLIKRRNKNVEKLYFIVEKLLNEETLDSKYRDHALINYEKGKNIRECHIEPDWLLVYFVDETSSILNLIATGTHSDLFDK